MTAQGSLSKNFLSIILFFLFWFGLFFYSGSLNSDYHFLDDHEIIKLNEQLKTIPIQTVIIKYGKEDLSWRFRPLWFIQRVIAIKIFGINFTLWSVYLGLLAVSTSFFLFKFFSIIKIPPLLSFLFSLLCLVGEQSVIWYQSADAENIGMFFLSLSLFFLARSIYSNKNISLYKSFFIISLILSSLCKESFLILVPAMLFLYLWLYSSENNLTIVKSIKPNLYLLAILLITTSVGLLIVIFFIGTNETSYVGVSSRIISSFFIKDTLYRIKSENIFIVIIFGTLLVIQNEFSKDRFLNFKHSIRKIKIDFQNVLVLFILIIIPQYALYFQSGIYTRYYLPLMLGFIFFAAYLVKIIYLRKNVNMIEKLSILLMLIFLLFFEMKDISIPYIVKHANDGKTVTNLLNSISDKINKDSTILAVIDPEKNYESSISFSTYLKSLRNMKKVNVKTMKPDIISDSNIFNFKSGVTLAYFKNDLFDSIRNKSEIQCVTVFPKLETKFLEENKYWFDKENFTREVYGSYTVYYKK